MIYIIDDPIAQPGKDFVTTAQANTWVDKTFKDRLDKGGEPVIIKSRLHESDDISGDMPALDGYKHLEVNND